MKRATGCGHRGDRGVGRHVVDLLEARGHDLVAMSRSRTASWAGLPGPSEVSYYDSLVEIHPSARKHGIADLYLGPGP